MTILESLELGRLLTFRAVVFTPVWLLKLATEVEFSALFFTRFLFLILLDCDTEGAYKR